MLRSVFSVSRGFTLIELIVAVAIMGVVAVMAVPSFQNMMASSQIRTAAEEVSNELQLARARAIATNVSQTYTVPAAIAAGAPGVLISNSGTDVTFNSWGRSTVGAVEVNFSKPADGACLAAAGQLRCMRVVVLTSGAVRICDPAAGTGSPMAC